MTGGEAAAAALESLGVEHVFGIVSVHNIPIYDAIARRGAIRLVPCRHEQGAVHAADGYARATGRLGVAITSTGPGAANAVSGLYEAAFASSPVLMLTGQVESRFYGKGKGFLHEAERQLDMLRTVTRRADSVRRAADIAATIHQVATDIRTGRAQPGAVEIPIDFQYAQIDVDLPTPAEPGRQVPDPAAVAAAVELLAAAERPVIWAGGGVVAAGAGPTLAALAERLGAPVVTSLAGRGSVPEDHELCVGAFATQRPVAAVLAEADALLAVGARFQAGETRNWSLPLPPRLVHLDADPGVIGRSYPAEIAIVADARLALEAVAAALPDRLAVDPGFTERAIKAGHEARAAARDLIGPDHAAVMDAIRELAPRATNIVRDATVPAYLWADRLLPVYEPRTSIRPTSAAIGPGLPLGIGAAIGSGRPTVVIHGDGGLMLSIGELATIAQERPPIVVCVFNDRGYGVLRAIEARQFDGRQVGVDLATPDFAALAAAVGMNGERVEGVPGFRAAFARAIESGAPALLDIDMSSLAPMGMFGPPRRPA